MLHKNGTPSIFTPETLLGWDTSTEIKHPDGSTEWVMARPLGWPGLCLRVRLVRAWKVFRGEYDVLKWKGNQ